MATAEEMIDSAREYAGDLVGEARNALEAAANYMNAESGAIINTIPNGVEIEGVTELDEPPDIGDLPELETFDLALPNAPDSLQTLDPIPAYVTTPAPVFSEQAPTFVLPSLPANQASFTHSAPSISNVAFPDPPAELDAPQLQPVVFGTYAAPDRPVVSLPGLPNAAPVFEGVEPQNLPDRFAGDHQAERATMTTLASAYVDQMIDKFAPNHQAGMAELESRLTKYMQGGTALAPEVEDAIYHRAQEKNDREAERVQRAAFADVAARGFTLPTGALAATLARARMEAASNNSKAASDIAVAQAELEQRNIQFAVTTSAALRSTVLNLTNAWLQGVLSINGQALESAKSILSAVIEAYNTAARAYATRLEGWKAEVAMFDSKIRLELSKVEVYKAEIQALEAEYSVDQMKVDQYKAEVSRLTSLADLYAKRIDAVMGQVTLEKSKIEIFQSQVQAYAAQTQAKQAEWQGFQAQVGGQTAAFQAYRDRVSAYSSEVQAHRTGIEAKLAEMNAVSTKNQSTVDAYRAQVQAYTAQVQALSAAQNANADTQRQKSTLYQAKINAASTQYQMNTVFYRNEADRIMTEARMKFDTALKRAELSTELAKLTSAVKDSLGGVYGNMAQAALSGMNTLAYKGIEE
jgi:hypothetical protein